MEVYVRISLANVFSVFQRARSLTTWHTGAECGIRVLRMMAGYLPNVYDVQSETKKRSTPGIQISFPSPPPLAG